MELRVWNIINPPNEPQIYGVEDVEEAAVLIEKLARMQLNDPYIVSNAFGLEEQEEDGEWSEYYNELGMDIKQIMEEEVKDA